LGAKYLVELCAGSTLPLAKQSLGFLLRENLLLYSSCLPLGVPNWTVKKHQHRAASSSLSSEISSAEFLMTLQRCM
jgi:hypothetical protein